MTWTTRDVEWRLREAAQVLKLMPDHDRRFLNGVRASWPDCVRDSVEAYGYSGDPGLIGEAEIRDPNNPQKRRTIKVAIPRDMDVGGKPRDVLEAIIDLNAAIDRMDEALPWLRWLWPSRQKFVWRRVSGMTYPDLGAIYHRTDRTCRRWFVESMEQIADELITLERET